MKRTKFPSTRQRTKYPVKSYFEKHHLEMLRKIAWSFHHTTGYDYEELFAEACVFYCEACDRYQKSYKVKLTTFAYRHVNNMLINFLKRQRENYLSDTGDMDDFTREDREAMDFNKFKGDVKILIDYVRFGEIDLSQMTPRNARGHIRRHFEEQGWSAHRIWDALKETKALMKEL